jgi:hypothetical protein
MKLRTDVESFYLRECSRDGDYIQYIDDPSEEVQLAAVNHTSSSIQYIKCPTERVQMCVMYRSISNIVCIQSPCKQAMDYLLTNEDLITLNFEGYKAMVLLLFKDNSIMVNKWLRYGNNIRLL